MFFKRDTMGWFVVRLIHVYWCVSVNMSIRKFAVLIQTALLYLVLRPNLNTTLSNQISERVRKISSVDIFFEEPKKALYKLASCFS